MSYTGVYEEPWNDKIEMYFKNLQTIASFHSKLNNEAGYVCRQKRINWGLPGVLIPVVMSPLVVMVGMFYSDHCAVITPSDYVASISLLFTGLFSGVSGFFNYGERTGKHFNVALLYDMIVDDVSLELTKGRQYRMQADVFMTKINMLMSSAARQEPIIPPNVLRSNETTKSDICKLHSDLSDEMLSISTPSPPVHTDIMNGSVVKNDFINVIP
jgi:hypothetical protein